MLQTFRCDLDHVARAIGEAVHFIAAIGNWPSHLPGKLRHDLVFHGNKRIDKLCHERRAF